MLCKKQLVESFIKGVGTTSAVIFVCGAITSVYYLMSSNTAWFAEIKRITDLSHQTDKDKHSTDFEPRDEDENRFKKIIDTIL